MKKIFQVALLSLLICACTSNPVLNFKDGYVPNNRDGNPQSVETVQDAIFAAATDRGWSPRLLEPGLIEATIFLRTHSATVEIPFNEESYSINYKDSTDLDYTGSSIHRNYNNWVLNLSNSIQRELGTR